VRATSSSDHDAVHRRDSVHRGHHVQDRHGQDHRQDHHDRDRHQGHHGQVRRDDRRVDRRDCGNPACWDAKAHPYQRGHDRANLRAGAPCAHRCHPWDEHPDAARVHDSAHLDDEGRREVAESDDPNREVAESDDHWVPTWVAEPTGAVLVRVRAELVQVRAERVQVRAELVRVRAELARVREARPQQVAELLPHQTTQWAPHS